MPLNLEPVDHLPLRRDERVFDDPYEGKGFILHNIRDFIREMTEGLFNWSEKASIWPLTFGIKCCAIEMMAFGAARYDSDRLGVFFRASPRQADLLIIAGPATIKLKDVILQLYEQMPHPKYVIAFGECAICGGPFWDSYSVINGVDKLIPVDVYVPGCPPRPEQLLLAIQKLQEVIESRRGKTEVVNVPTKSREELLAEIMAHPTYQMGHQSGQPRFTPTADELLMATPTGQPAEAKPKRPITAVNAAPVTPSPATLPATTPAAPPAQDGTPKGESGVTNSTNQPTQPPTEVKK